MPSSFSIRVDLSDVIGANNAVSKEVFPRLHEAVGAVAETARQRWADKVKDAPGVWIEEKNRYMQSIRWEYNGDFAATVWTDEKVAEWIESGRPARDLKKMLDTSEKVRRTEDGRRFLVIPLRHNTPGNDAHASSMPASVFAIAGAMGKSRVTGSGHRPAGEVTRLSPKAGMMASPNQSPYLSNPATKSDFMVQRSTYQWGDRLKVADTAPTVMRGRAAAAGNAGVRRIWADQYKHYAGMVRMESSSGKQSSSVYMTFRIMMEGSSGWVVPAKPGLWLAKGVSESLQPVANQVFSQAINFDFKR